MKKVLASILLFLFVISLSPSLVSAKSYRSSSGVKSSYKVSKTVRVKGYVTKKGKYVAPHYRTSPNKTKLNNWSTKGNVNPYTGKKGTKKPY